MKWDIKNVFKNVLVALYYQWLLGVIWKNKYYKEICLSFGLSTALFIFNLFSEGLYWILVSYLRWSLVHYFKQLRQRISRWVVKKEHTTR